MDETGSGAGHLLGIQRDADEVAHREDVVAAGAMAPEPHVATPLIAFATASFAQKALPVLHFAWRSRSPAQEQGS